MGVVVEARHIALDERVALKFLLPDYAQHPEASARFLREARAAVKIKSEHVARVSDVGTLDSGAPYMVMEYLEGSDLSNVLVKAGTLSIPDAVDYIVQGCEAIAEAHGYGIVHRDLKPANLFLGKRPNGLPIIKVLDFGISKVMDGAVDNLTKTTAAMGSALYMSPEQMQQTRGVDNRTDIYALGISLYELLAGRQPFYAETLPQLCAEVFAGTPTPIRTLRPEVPEELAVVMEKAYARDRALRYQSIADFVIALAPFAPPRSRVILESVAKMAGLEPPASRAPMASVPGSPSHPPPGLSQSAPGAPALSLHTGGPVVASTTPPAPARSRAGLVAVAVVGVLGLGAAGAFFGLRGSGAPAAAGPPTSIASAPRPPDSPTATTATTTASAAVSAVPSATPSAVPSATPQAASAAPHAPVVKPNASPSSRPHPVPAVSARPKDVGF
jgi:serine/threonine-protein kinase